MQALPHFGSTMIQQHGAVFINMHQGARLVVHWGGEGDPEFHRRQRESAFDHGVTGVPRGDGRAPRSIAARCFKLSSDCMNHVVFDRLTVVGHVAIMLAVEIDPAYVERVASQRARNVIDNALDHHHRLRPAKASKCRVRHRMRLAAMRNDLHMFEKIGVVHVAHGAIVHRTG